MPGPLRRMTTWLPSGEGRLSDPFETLKRSLAATLVREDDDQDTVERARVRKALAALQNYLREVGIPLELRADIHKLAAALEDVARGRTNELLTPAKALPDTPKKKSFEASHETMAAAALTILVQAGWKLDSALSYVATGLRLNRKALGDYRKNLTGRKIKGEALDHYYEWLRDGDRYSLSPMEHVKMMIETGSKYSSKA